jgi:hypothetical protein
MIARRGPYRSGKRLGRAWAFGFAGSSPVLSAIQKQPKKEYANGYRQW